MKTQPTVVFNQPTFFLFILLLKSAKKSEEKKIVICFILFKRDFIILM